jgi:MtN3 and saliva related transmembrane protein
MWVKQLIAALFGLSLFANAALFVPQAVKIFKKRSAKGLSFLTFFGFCIFQLIAVLYGWLHGDKIILIGYLLSFLTCGAVTALMILYRKA